MQFEGFIRKIRYDPQFDTDRKLLSYSFHDFNINECKSYGLIQIKPHDHVAYAKWGTPKRTRTYPFARLYNIYDTNATKIAIIPVIKDEGGDSNNNDRINAITFSWMNLLNIHIVLGYYVSAEKKKGKKNLITNQKLDNEYIKNKIIEISKNKMSALHWNTLHFEEDFIDVYQKCIKNYIKISAEQNVKLHSSIKHRAVLVKYLDKGSFSLDKFKDYTNLRSQEAQKREAATDHIFESLVDGSKALFNLSNYLGGNYYLTADEVFFEKEKIVIQESKNASDDKLPKKTDIKEGLFKLILYSNLDELKYNNKSLPFTTRLKLTGQINNDILLPINEKEIMNFLDKNNFSKNEKIMLTNLNKEAQANNLTIHISGNE